MKTRLGFAILTVLPLLAVVIDSRVCIGHFVQGEWPPHEMFHLLMGLGGLLTAYGLILVLVRIPLRRGERWAWYGLWVYPVFWSAHLLGNLPPGQDHIHQVVFIILSLASLLVSMRVFFPPGKD